MREDFGSANSSPRQCSRRGSEGLCQILLQQLEGVISLRPIYDFSVFLPKRVTYGSTEHEITTASQSSCIRLTVLFSSYLYGMRLQTSEPPRVTVDRELVVLFRLVVRRMIVGLKHKRLQERNRKRKKKKRKVMLGGYKKYIYIDLDEEMGT